MGTKKTFIFMSVMFVVCMGYWLILVRYVYPKHPNWDYNGVLNQPADTSTPATTAPSTMASTMASTMQSGAGLSTTPSMSATTGSLLVAASTQPAASAQLVGSVKPDPDYALGLSVAAEGAGLDSVAINSYKAADAKEVYSFQDPYPGDEERRSMATRSISVDGKTCDLSGAVWYLEAGRTESTATFGADVDGADHLPLVHIDKTYHLAQRGPKKDRDNTAAGYEVSVTYHVKNATNRALNDVHLEFDGPTMPPQEMERSDDRQIVAGYDKGDSAIDVTRNYLGEFKTGSDDKDLSVNKTYKFLWAGESSVYFGAIVRPEKQGQIDQIHARCLNPGEEAANRIVVLEFRTAGASLAAGGSLEVPLKVFFGPKERDLFEGDYFKSFPLGYNQLLATSSSFCGICALPWLVDSLVDLLQGFHWVLHDWGLAIIALVLLVRAILHPISKYSQVSMLKLQKMGPEMERLKKKHTDDKDALAKAQMEMHKEMGITPFLGCLPMFLQMPIWIALYSALQNDIVLRQAPFLWGWTWIHDLARPDRMISWDAHGFMVPFVGMKLVSLNVLPLIVAAVMFIQQKIQPQAPSMTPEQESQQKMMRYVSLAFSLFFYWMPSGLNLYILTSSTIAIFESKRIRAHIKEIEAREKAGPVIVDAKPTRQGKQNQKQDPKAKALESKPGCLGGVWANLQQKAEDVRREGERKSRKG